MRTIVDKLQRISAMASQACYCIDINRWNHRYHGKKKLATPTFLECEETTTMRQLLGNIKANFNKLENGSHELCTEHDEGLSHAAELPMKVKIQQAFDFVDLDHNGTVDFEELKRVMEHIGVDANERDLRREFEEADIDHSGELDFEEFKGWFMQHHTLTEKLLGCMSYRWTVKCVWDDLDAVALAAFDVYISDACFGMSSVTDQLREIRLPRKTDTVRCRGCERTHM